MSIQNSFFRTIHSCFSWWLKNISCLPFKSCFKDLYAKCITRFSKFSDVSHDRIQCKKEHGNDSYKQLKNPITHVTKGKYFKNRDTDIETDGQAISLPMDQWFWKDETGTWNPYTKETNDRINKCFKRDPKSTVIVTVKEQS